MVAVEVESPKLSKILKINLKLVAITLGEAMGEGQIEIKGSK